MRDQLLAFSFCDYLRVTRIRLTNSADKHMTLFRCSQALVDGVSIAAPPDSPNTDGITVASSNHTLISNCSIRSGIYIERIGNAIAAEYVAQLTMSFTDAD